MGVGQLPKADELESGRQEPTFYELLLVLGAQANGNRPELVAAQAFLAQ